LTEILKPIPSLTLEIPFIQAFADFEYAMQRIRRQLRPIIFDFDYDFCNPALP
jgi:hypothetical protein